MSLVRFKTGLEEKSKVDSMTVFNSEEVDTKKQPMFFGKPLGIQRYDSYKYPIFDKLTTQQLGYFWRQKKFLYRRIAATIIRCVLSKSISLPAI